MSIADRLRRMVASVESQKFENAAPVSYAPRQSLSIPLGGVNGFNTNSAVTQMNAMGSVGTLFAIVHRTSNATSSAEWKLWRKAKSGKKEDRVEVTSHLALDIWNKPNPFMTQQEFVETFQQHLDLTGEAWWIVSYDERLKSIPLELWPARPDRMSPVPDPEEFIAGYIYTGPGGEKEPLTRAEVVFLRMPNPSDIYRGMGPVQSILTDLDSTKYSAEWNRQYFLNSAEPGGIIELPETLEDDEYKQLVTRWREQHQGVGNAHRVAILERGVYKDRSGFSQRDMQFAELRNVSREVIREAFGFPKPLLGSVDDVNRANAEAAEVVFARWLIRPRLERIAQALNNDFLPLFGATAQGLEFDYENPVPEDREADNAELAAKSGAAQVYINLGFEPAEVLAVLGLPEMTHTAPAAPAIAPAPADTTANPFDTWRNALVPAEVAVRNRKGPHTQVDLGPAQKAWEKALDGVVKQWAGVREEWIDALVHQVREVIEGGDLSGLVAISVPTEKAQSFLHKAMDALAKASAQHVVAEASDQGVDVKPAMPSSDSLLSRAGATVAILGATYALSAAREALRVSASTTTGTETANAVKDALNDLTDAQPRLALGGALTMAQNQARFQTLVSGPIAALYASEQNDANTCGPCGAVDGRWLGNSDGVDMSDVDALYPSGYIDCEGGERCRGTVVGVWRDNASGGDEDE